MSAADFKLVHVLRWALYRAAIEPNLFRLGDLAELVVSALDAGDAASSDSNPQPAQLFDVPLVAHKFPSSQAESSTW